MKTMIFLILAVVVASFVGVTVATRNSTSGAGRLDDYFQRHPSLSISVSDPQVDNTGSDYYERHQAELARLRGVDTTDYAARHPELAHGRGVDTTDYAARHPGLSLSAARQVDLTDYYFRHPELSSP